MLIKIIDIPANSLTNGKVICYNEDTEKFEIKFSENYNFVRVTPYSQLNPQQKQSVNSLI